MIDLSDRKKNEINYKEVAKLIKEIEKNDRNSEKESASISFQRESSITKLEALSDFESVLNGRLSTSFSKLAEIATKMYKVNGTFAQIVDKLSALIGAGITVDTTGDEELDNKYRFFCKYMNSGRQTTTRGLEYFINTIMTEYVKVGNVFAYYDKNTLVKNGYIHQLNEETGQWDCILIDGIKVPQYGILNPTLCEIDKDKADKYELSLKYDNKNFEKDFYHIARKSDYEIYGSMLFTKMSMSLYSLVLVDVMSASTIDGLIKVFTLLKIPNDFAHKAKEILQTLLEAKRANLPLVVNQGTELEIKSVKGEYTDLGKYKQDTLRSAYNNAGLSLPMMTGEGDVDREVFESYILNLITFVEKEQKVFLPFIESMFEKFAEINNLPMDKIPNISVEKNIFNLLLFDKYFLQMYDRGILSGLDVLVGTGFNEKQTIFNMSRAKQLKEQYGFGIPNDTGYYGKNNNNPDINKNIDDDSKKGNEGETKDVKR